MLRNGGCLVIPFVSLWVLLWTAGTLSFDVLLARATWMQSRTQWFDSVQGTVLHSEVEVEHDEGTTYSVEVKYKYQVNGQAYESQRFRYAQTSGSRRWTYATVAAMPEGQAVTVYYDPAQPGESVLMPGLAMCDFLPTVFLLPFNLVMLGTWAAIFYALGGSIATADLPASTRLLTGQHGEVVRFPGVSPVLAAGCASGGAAFVLIFVLGFGFEMHGPIWPVVVAWALIIGAGVAAARWARRDQESGQYDLLLNDSRRMVALPQRRDDFQSPDWLPLDQLRQTAVFEEVTKDSDGDEVKKYITQFLAHNDRRLNIHTWSSEDDARKLAEWLAQRLRLTPPVKARES